MQEADAGGPGIGAEIVPVWSASGRPGHLAEHPVTPENTFIATNSQHMESLGVAAPVACAVDWLMLFSGLRWQVWRLERCA